MAAGHHHDHHATVSITGSRSGCGRRRSNRSVGAAALAGLLWLATACSSSAGEPARSTGTAAGAGNGSGTLTADVFNDGVYCDGSERDAAIVFGAEPGETIVFSSPMPVDVADGVADDRGTYQLPWRCDPNEASLEWELTATGATSGRSVRFRLSGSYDNPDLDRSLAFTPDPDPLVCDGNTRVVGRLENAEPGEPVEFVAEGAGPLRQGRADGGGELDVRWSCRPEDGERTWTVDAVGEQSGRATSFELAGRLPEPAGSGPIEVELIENPVACTRERRRVAVLGNLTPMVVVSFRASPSEGALGDGRADAGGSLDVYWQCSRSQADTVWTVTATEQAVAPGQTEGRSATITVTGSASPDPTTITVVEDPFLCDGDSRRFAVLSNLVPGEYVDFDSPQSEAIRQGQADQDGDVAVRWQCSPDQAGTRWEVTATGQTSGLSLTFTITGR